MHSLSNGYNLDDYLIDEIIDSKIDIFKISVVGYDEQTYEKMMSKDAFKYVRENVKNLVRQTKGTNTRVQSQHLILDPEKKDYEVEQLRKNWIDYTGIDAEIWLMHNWSGVYEGKYTKEVKKTEEVVVDHFNLCYK